ncbi:hypothetical protein D3C84_1100480 [compost metagenome]
MVAGAALHDGPILQLTGAVIVAVAEPALLHRLDAVAFEVELGVEKFLVDHA